MKRAIAIALAALCAAPALGSWHCSALNRDFTYPINPWRSSDQYVYTNVTMSTKEGCVAVGSGLEWMKNVAAFRHDTMPTNYAKLANHALTTNLLPKAYHEWMYGAVGEIFTTDWHHPYVDGSNTVEVLALSARSPWMEDSDYMTTNVYDFGMGDYRHAYYSYIFGFYPPEGTSPMVLAMSNSVKRILGREPQINPQYAEPMSLDFLFQYFPGTIELVFADSNPPNLKYLLNSIFPGFPLMQGFTVEPKLVFKLGGASPFSVESKHRRYTTHTKFTVTIETNADYTATMSFTHKGYGVAESTNIEHTVVRKTLGQTAAAKSEAFGYPWSVSAKSPTKVFLRGDPVSHVFDIDGTVVSAYCIPLWYAWASNMTYEVDLPYVLDYTLSRIRADEPPGRSHYPPALAGSDIYHQFATRAWTPFKAVADGMDYDCYTYYDHETVASGGLNRVDNGMTGDAMRLVCDMAAEITNDCGGVTFDMYAEDGAGWLLPQITYDEVQEDATIEPMPVLSNGYHQVFAAYRADNSEYLGWCTTNNWALNVRHIIDHGPAMVFEHQPTYSEASARPIYDVYHGDYPWALELKVDMDAYGSWDFNNWLR
ncbi:MAG: hypothetical protein IJG70_05920 [Kiritimatiellae bacterium]|nr:hypothetical protein [Kiritimatiellia bacterium]